MSEWAAPVMKEAGFKKKHRVFTATGSHGATVKVEFRLHPLVVGADTFWCEWSHASTHEATRWLNGRVPIAPTMSMDPDMAAFNVRRVDPYLWCVSARTIGAYGPLLLEQIKQFLPAWRHVLASPTGTLSDTLRHELFQLTLPHEGLKRVAAAVVAGHLHEVEDEIREFQSQLPDNVWVKWWAELLQEPSDPRH